MTTTEALMEQVERFEEDSAVLKGLRDRANDMGYTTVGEALDELTRQDSRGH